MNTAESHKTGPISKEDMKEILGTPIAARQAECLRKNGIRFVLDVNDRPKLTWEALNMQIVGVQHPAKNESPNDGFNLDNI